MRDEQHFDIHDEADLTGRRPISRWKAALGATVSVMMLSAVVVWAYSLGVRDAHDVPVVRAIEGPAKTRPEEPGGAQFAHQGLAVYGALDASAATRGGAAPIAPAPEALAKEDAPAASFSAAAPVAPVVVAPLAAGGAQPALDALKAAEAAPAVPVPNAAAEVDQLVAAVLGQAPAVQQAAAPQRVVVPARRPTQGAPAATAPAAAAASAPAASAGGLHIQLGAYLTEADAMRMWGVIRGRTGDLLAGRSPVVAPLEGANRTLYRLRATPVAGAEDARVLCAAMQARREDCIVTGAN